MAYHPNRKLIHRFDWLYWLLKPWVNFSFRRYYRKVQCVHQDRIPQNMPVIFAPNHQNALMDALAVLYTTHGQPVFLARADIFKNPIQARVLHFLKIMPVFRIRDGAENLSQNDEIFQAALNVLSTRHQLCLMPEGNHGDKRRLRPLVKGIFRIAFLTEEKLDNSLPVQIVPVGIDYGHYQNFRNTLLVIYGEPIDVSRFMPQYRENKARAMNMLREFLAERLRKLMIDIRNDEYYDVIYELRGIYTPVLLARNHQSIRDLYTSFVADKAMTSKLDEMADMQPQNMESLAQKVRTFHDSVVSMRFRYWLFDNRSWGFLRILGSLLLLLTGLPVFIYGWIHNYIPYRIPVKFLKIKKVKDPQFFSSFKFVLGFLLFPLVYLLFFIVFLLITGNGWLGLLYLISLPVSGWLAFSYYILYRKTEASIRFRYRSLKKDPELIRIKELRRDIISDVDRMMAETHNS